MHDLPATSDADPGESSARPASALPKPDAQTVVFFVLALATVVSWLLGTENAASWDGPVGVAAITIAFVKLRLVGLYFMELRDAPAPLRWIFEGYTFVTFAVVLVLFAVA